MFVMESWPAPGGPTGLRIVASESTEIVGDVFTAFPDIVIWGRKVPDVWAGLIRGGAAGFLPVALNGPIEQVLTCIRDVARRQGPLVFLGEDIKQTLSLTAALGRARSVKLTAHAVTESIAVPISAGTQLCALCLYGYGTMTLLYEDGACRECAVKPDPHAIVFFRPLVQGNLVAEFEAERESACIAVVIEVTASTRTALF